MRVWMLLVFGRESLYGGHSGYADEVDSWYEYDSFVANHGKVQERDLVLIRDSVALLGVARIEQIESSESSKDRFVCPSCGRHQITLCVRARLSTMLSRLTAVESRFPTAHLERFDQVVVPD